MPIDLKNKKLTEVTSQPLLNYLVALSFIRGKVDFKKASNLNVLYADLIDAVYERSYAPGPSQILKLSQISKELFCRILEEISISTWHGKGRTTTVEEIENHFENANLKKLLDNFKKIAETGVVNLLTAFYFKRSKTAPSSEQTFEFTHKTFREYLTAKRIVSMLEFMHSKIDNKNKNLDDIWDEKEILKHWLILFGPSNIDDYLYEFIKDEISMRDESQVQEWQIMLANVISFFFRYSMPFERLEKRPSFAQELILSRNAGKALFDLLSACANRTKKISNLEPPVQEAFGLWFNRMLDFEDIPYPADKFHFDFLDLSESYIVSCNFCSCDFSNSIFKNSVFVQCSFEFSNFSFANLSNCLMRFSYVSITEFEGTNFENVDFSFSNIDNMLISHDTHFKNMNFSNSRITNIDHEGNITLKNVNFDGSVLSEKFYKEALKLGANLDNIIGTFVESEDNNIEEDVKKSN